jgi:hypothetical protein
LAFRELVSISRISRAPLAEKTLDWREDEVKLRRMEAEAEEEKMGQG